MRGGIAFAYVNHLFKTDGTVSAATITTPDHSRTRFAYWLDVVECGAAAHPGCHGTAVNAGRQAAGCLLYDPATHAAAQPTAVATGGASERGNGGEEAAGGRAVGAY